MPKPMIYKANSIIYFKGDLGDKTYILNSGKVSLNYIDIETGQEIHDLVQTGEFFGVKSAMGKFGREETAVVLTDAQVVAFSVPEFELLVQQNDRIIIKMLKVFSNQLRRIHKQVQNRLHTEEEMSPENGLFSIGEYYLKTKAYPQANYAFRRYLTYYPSGTHSQAAVKNIEMSEQYLQKYGAGKGPDILASKGDGAPASMQTEKPQQKRTVSGVEQRYYAAVTLISQEKYQDAFKEFKAIAEAAEDEEFQSKAQYEMARCMYFLNQNDASIQLLTTWVQRYPKHPDLKDALFYIGASYEKKADRVKATALFRKVIGMTTENETLHHKAKKALKILEGG